MSDFAEIAKSDLAKHSLGEMQDDSIPVSFKVANQSYAFGHKLGCRPTGYLVITKDTAGDILVSDSEKAKWNEFQIVVHATAVPMKATLKPL